jgi:hypothetical protein
LADQGNDDQARQVLDEARTLGSGKTIDPTVAVHAHHVLHAAGAAAEPPPRDVLDLHAQLAWAVLDASQ